MTNELAEYFVELIEELIEAKNDSLSFRDGTNHGIKAELIRQQNNRLDSIREKLHNIMVSLKQT
jgi:hypothetical protein